MLFVAPCICWSRSQARRHWQIYHVYSRPSLAHICWRGVASKLVSSNTCAHLSWLHKFQPFFYLKSNFTRYSTSAQQQLYVFCMQWSVLYWSRVSIHWCRYNPLLLTVYQRGDEKLCASWHSPSQLTHLFLLVFIGWGGWWHGVAWTN